MPSPADRAFGALLKKARDDAGLSSQNLADLLYVKRESVDRYLRGDRRPHENLVARWEEICEVSPGSLLDARRDLPPRSRQALAARESPSDDGGTPLAPAEPDEPPRVPRSVPWVWTARRTGVVVVGLAFVLGLSTAAYMLGHSDRSASNTETNLRAYIEAVNAIMARLDLTHVDERSRLQSADTPVQRAGAADRLSRAFARAAAAHRTLRAPASAQGANRNLQAVLARAADGYRAMVSAVRSQRDGAFQRARQGVTRGEAALATALRALRSSVAAGPPPAG